MAPECALNCPRGVRINTEILHDLVKFDIDHILKKLAQKDDDLDQDHMNENDPEAELHLDDQR